MNRGWATTVLAALFARLNLIRPTARSHDAADRFISQGGKWRRTADLARLIDRAPSESRHSSGTAYGRRSRRFPKVCERTKLRVRLHRVWRLNHDGTCIICSPAFASTASEVACGVGQRDKRAGGEGW